MTVTGRIFLPLVSLFMFVMPVLAAPKWPLPEGVKSVEVNSYDMAYQEAGSGVPLVLVHGSINDIECGLRKCRNSRKIIASSP